jgi:hypothetical protein
MEELQQITMRGLARHQIDPKPPTAQVKITDSVPEKLQKRLEYPWVHATQF